MPLSCMPFVNSSELIVPFWLSSILRKILNNRSVKEIISTLNVGLRKDQSNSNNILWKPRKIVHHFLIAVDFIYRCWIMHNGYFFERTFQNRVFQLPLFGDTAGEGVRWGPSRSGALSSPWPPSPPRSCSSLTSACSSCVLRSEKKNTHTREYSYIRFSLFRTILTQCSINPFIVYEKKKKKSDQQTRSHTVQP